MSDPLTSHEIEDVLSSIRRLVSEDLRPARAAKAAARAAVEQPDADDKLLLTPALRVVTDAAARAVPAPGDQAPLAGQAHFEDTLVFQDAGGDPGHTDQALIAGDDGFEMALQAEAEVWGSSFEGAAAAAVAMPAGNEIYDDAGMHADEPAGFAADVAAEDLIWPAAGRAQDSTDTVIPQDGATGHGYWVPQDVHGMDWTQEETDWVEPDPVPFVAYPRKPELASDPLARAWADRAEAQVRAELEDGVAASVSGAAAAGHSAFEADEAALDEEVLREIVREILREELSGALGERITRNVRKLVRMEVNRAMVTRDFQ